MTAAGGASRGARLNTASHLLALSFGVFLLTSLAPGTGSVRAEVGDEVRIEIEAHGLEESVYRDVTLSFALTLVGQSAMLLSGEGPLRVSAGLEGRVVVTGALGPDGALHFEGTAFIPGGILVDLTFAAEPGEPLGRTNQCLGSAGSILISPETPLTVVFGPIPPDSEIFPGETLAFRGTAFIFALLPISPDC